MEKIGGLKARSTILCLNKTRMADGLSNTTIKIKPGVPTAIRKGPISGNLPCTVSIKNPLEFDHFILNALVFAPSDRFPFAGIEQSSRRASELRGLLNVLHGT